MTFGIIIRLPAYNAAEISRGDCVGDTHAGAVQA
jgi:hypothetical protein